jgi:hypothetical protein
MSDENNNEVTAEALQEQMENIMKVHSIEREMLSRAIYVLSDLTKKTPEQVVALLSESLDEEYMKAVKTVEENAKKPKLYVPSEKKLKTDVTLKGL